MNKILLCAVLIISSVIKTNAATITSNGTGGGNWATGASWSGGVAPIATDNVVVAAGDSIYINAGITRSGTIVVSAGGVLSTSVTLTNNVGAVTINGIFQISSGGFANGTGTWTYGANGTLVYNNNAGFTFGAGHVYWPTVSGPVNVSVLGTATGGLDMNSVARTISGTFTVAAKLSNWCNLSLNGVIILNSGYSFQGSCGSNAVYNCTSTLKYNSGGVITRGNEWTTAITPGNLEIGNNTTMNYPTAGAGTICGNLIIDAGSSLYMDYGGGSAALTVGKDITINGNLSLGTSVGGDLTVGGNWTRAAAGTAFNTNNRTVFFNKSGTQIITNGAGTETFAYITLLNTSSLKLSSSPATNVNITAQGGLTLTSANTATSIDLNGQTMTLTTGGGNFDIGGGTRNIVGAAGSIFAFTGGIGVTTTVTNGGTLGFGSNVSVNLTGGLNAQYTTINGTLQINNAGFITINAPIYATGSFLIYNEAAFNRSTEWSALSGTGYPYNVIVGNGVNCALDLSTNGFANRACAGNLTITSGSSLTMNNTNKSLSVYGSLFINGTLTLSTVIGGDIYVSGNWNRATGTFVPNSRAVFFQGAGTSNINVAETYPYLRLIKTSPASVILFNNITIIYEISPTSGNLTLSNYNVILHSDASATASVTLVDPAFTFTYNGTGQFVAQRYYPAHRAWRLVGVPVVSAQMINAAWQEGVYNTSYSPWPASDMDPNPSYGTHISGTQSPAGLGFDATPHNNPSMQTYNGGSPVLGTDSWTGVPNTLSTSLNYRTGYMLFVRGSRAVNLPLNTAAPADNTVVRSTGTLRTYAQTFNCPANSFTLIGNPYPSTIDFAGLTRNALNNSFSVWDPNLTGTYSVGAYVTYTWTGASYVAAPSPASAGLGQNIQSGQAFLVQNNTGAATTLVVNEANKVSGSVSTIFTPLQAIESLRTNLYSMSDTSALEDGTLAIFNNAYSAGIDDVDALKPTNFRETISHSNSGRSLAIEAKPIIVSSDTLFYNMILYQQPYRFEFIASGLDHPGLTGYLHDSYLQTDTPISLNDTTRVDFVANSDIASSDNNRFSIILTTNNPLPVTLNSIRAYSVPPSGARGLGINVDWKVSQEVNMDRYEVEKSLTGRSFIKLGTVAATGNSSSAIGYTWYDATPNTGANYYRVKMLDRNRHYTYSSIVKVVIEKSAPAITVYPNPVTTNTIVLQITNIDKGNYTLQLINKLGQVVYTKQVDHAGGSATQTITLDKNLAKGSYELKLGSFTIQVIKE